jgi:NADH-ubiquinone oxidoreductase chain 6
MINKLIINTLFILIDNYINGYKVQLLVLISLISLISGIFVIISKNPIISVLFLIGLFLCISTYLMLSGMTFIGIAYLLVYIGAVSILFLFILMLINVRISELQGNTNNSLPLALIIGAFLYYFLYGTLPFTDLDTTSDKILDVVSLNNYDDNKENLYVTSNIWDTVLVDVSHIVSIGNVIYTNYFIWIVIASIILLLAMVGTIIITIKY